MLGWIYANPLKCLAIGIIGGSPIMDVCLRRKAQKELQAPIYKKIVSGSKPSVPVSNRKSVIPRPQLEADLSKFFLTKPAENEFTRFGVIIGPSGCGKTHAVRDLCSKVQRGLIYYEIEVANTFATGLSQSLGMKLSPTTALDLLLSYISQDYCHYHNLPDTGTAALHYALEVMEKSASAYTKKYRKIPVLFIDGVDILAKHDPNLCEVLITLAKILANNNKVKIVLISSEGTIMPLLRKLSAANRALIYEVGDISDAEATTYLMKNQVAKDTAKEVVKCVGGRLVDLQSCVERINDAEKSGDICQYIQTTLFSRVLSGQKSTAIKGMPESLVVMNELVAHNDVSPPELISKAKSKDKMDRVIQQMIDENIIRYDVRGNVKWYGKMQERELSKMVTEEPTKDEGTKE